MAPLVAAVKFQSAFYEAYGPPGVAALHATAAYRPRKGPDRDHRRQAQRHRLDRRGLRRGYLGKVPVGGSFEPSWQADAITVNPYLGSDGVVPFIKVAAREQKGVFVLVRTSNTSAGEFQDLVADGKPLYRHVADRLKRWAEPHRGEAGIQPRRRGRRRDLSRTTGRIAASLPGIVLLVPGYGTQGATARDVAAAFDENGLGALINNSRGITFAYERPAYHARFGGDWQSAIAQAVRDMIDDLAANTSAGRLRAGAADRELTSLARSRPRPTAATMGSRLAHISGNVPRLTARWTMNAPVPNNENGTASMKSTLQL